MKLVDKFEMKILLKIMHLVFFVCIYSIIFFSIQVNAEEFPLHIQKQINHLNSAKKVTVFISSRPFDGAGSIESAKFNQCSFIAKDVKNIEGLIGILKQSKIKKHTSNELYLPVIGLIIEASFKDKSKMVFVFGREYLNENSLEAELILPSSEKFKLSANRQIYQNIYKWLKDIEIQVMANPEKWQSINDCELTKRKGLFRDEKSYLTCNSITQGMIQNEVNQCLSLKSKNFYRDSEQQQCNQSEFYMPSPDVCITGWK